MKYFFKKEMKKIILQQVFAECLLGDQTLLSRSLWSSRGSTWILIVMSVDQKDEEMCNVTAEHLDPRDLKGKELDEFGQPAGSKVQVSD